MDSDDQTPNSEPTMAFGYRPTPQDEPSSGSAPTAVPGRGRSPSAPPSLGRIDQYELIRKLGGGGFGVVYLARDTVSGIDVALKTLHPLMKSNAEEMERLREKFALVSRLSHPNIASALVLHPVREVMINDAAVWNELRLSPGDSVMVMRYAPGITLSKWRRQFKDGVVPLGAALEVGRQIAAALDYAHGERIVHRDIKPANVMVETLPSEASQPRSNSQMVSSSNSPSADHPTIGLSDHRTIRPSDYPTIGLSDHPTKIRVRILDFGLAAEIRSSMSRVSSETGDTSGTRPYMAPEQWLGKKQDGRTDQYALACVLYELLSGAPPFAGVFETGDPAIMKDAVVRDAPDEIDGVSPAVNAALLKALSKNPKDRFASCAEFVAALDVRASSPSEPQKKSGKGWLVAALGVAAVAAAVGLALPRKGGASSPSEPPPVETRAFSSVTQDSAAEYERRVAEERKAREEAERKAKEEAERKTKEEAKRLAREEAERKKREAEEAARREREAKAAAEKAESERQEAERKKARPGEIYALDLGGGVKLEMVPCPGVARDFWMGKYEVTQEQWLQVMGSNPSHFGNPKNPVETVSWYDCRWFVEKLNALPAAKSSGLMFRLPTEKEWETACRAGAPKSADYCIAADGMQIKAATLGKVAHYNKEWDAGPISVGSFQSNAWGLFDMHGNVWEWTSTEIGGDRVYCGGSFIYAADFCTAGSRLMSNRDEYSVGSLGFRLAASGIAATANAERERQDAEHKAKEEADRRNHEHGKVQLWEGGPYWATRNIGAEKPEDSGLYFWWGDTIGYRSEGDAWVASDGSTQHFSFSYWKTPTHGKGDATLRRKGWTTSAGVLAPEHDAAHVHWGGNWRMPTKQEFGDLVSKCDWTKTTMNGVKGYVVRGRGAYADASIFLPAAGLGGGTSLSGAGLGGNYWSSVPNSGSNYSWGLSFSSGYPGSNTSYFRSSGQSVRPVLEVAE